MIISCDLFKLIQWTSSVISILSTVLLFYLIRKSTPKEMKSYAWLLFYLSATDAVTNILLFLGDFEMLVFQPPVIIGAIRGPLIFHDCARLYFAAFAASMTANWLGIPLCYAYRYYALMDLSKYQWLLSKRTLTFIFLFIALDSLVIFLLLFFGINGSDTQESIRIPMQPYLQHLAMGDEIFGVVCFWWSYIWIVIAMINQYCAYVFIIRTSWRIVSFLRQHRTSMSPVTYRGQIRLFYALAIQTALPLITILSTGGLVLGLVADINTTTLKCCMAIEIALNPICTIVFVDAYRRKVGKMLRFWKSSRSRSIVSISVSRMM